jgi:Peptidoglycan-binding protein, CsiV
MNHQLLAFLALAMLLPGIGLAQSTTETEVKVIPRYDVEIIIFRNIQAPKSKEFIFPVSSPSKGDRFLDLSSASSVAEAQSEGYELLPADEFRLLDVVTRLIESPRYELLLHATWRQPGLGLEQVLPVWIKGGRIYGNEYTSIDSQIEFLESIPQVDSNQQDEDQNFAFDEQTLESLELQLLEQQAKNQHQGLYELEGKITIALSRYLHTYTDLVLRRPRLTVDPKLRNVAQDRYLAAYSADTRILNNHSLKEHRRMRSKTLHYLDNPEFAMLILITPYKAPEDIVETPVETEATTSE